MSQPAEAPRRFDPERVEPDESWMEQGVRFRRWLVGETVEQVSATRLGDQGVLAAWTWRVGTVEGHWWSSLCPPLDAPLTEAEFSTFVDEKGPRTTEANALRDVACELAAALMLIQGRDGKGERWGV